MNCPCWRRSSKSVEQILAQDERWLKALAERGLDVDKVRVAPLSAGVFSTRRRRAGGSCAAWPSTRVPGGQRLGPPDRGLVAYVDVVDKSVDQVLDFGAVPVPPSTATTRTRN